MATLEVSFFKDPLIDTQLKIMQTQLGEPLERLNNYKVLEETITDEDTIIRMIDNWASYYSYHPFYFMVDTSPPKRCTSQYSTTFITGCHEKEEMFPYYHFRLAKSNPIALAHELSHVVLFENSEKRRHICWMETASTTDMPHTFEFYEELDQNLYYLLHNEITFTRYQNEDRGISDCN
jgi:hypothetical protein